MSFKSVKSYLKRLRRQHRGTANQIPLERLDVGVHYETLGEALEIIDLLPKHVSCVPRAWFKDYLN